MATAWDLIGTPNLVRIKGGRTTYESVSFEDTGRATKVRLSRLDAKDGLRQINRYVDPDTVMEIVPEDMQGRVIVRKVGGATVEGIFDGWFAGADVVHGLQVATAALRVAWVDLDEIISIEPDPYA
jgi:ribosomal protein S28E/S33